MHTLSFDLETKIVVSGEPGEWKGFVEPPGVVVRGKTRNEILKLALDATAFMMKRFEKDGMSAEAVCKYFDQHGVKYEVVVHADTDRLG